MAERLGDAILELRTRDKNLSRGINKGRKDARKLDRQFDAVSRSGERMARTLRNAFATIGISVVVAAVVQMTRAVASAGLEMERFERGLKFVTGSIEGADKEMAFLRQEADRLGLNLRATAGAFVSLAAAAKGTGLEGQATRDIFVGISEAATVLGLSSEQTRGALTAIEQMISKGRVSAEELRQQLGERLPGAFQLAARSIGVTTAELDKMLMLGEVTAEELLPALARELHKTFGPEVPAAADSAQAAFNRFNTAIFELQNAIAQSGILDGLAALADLLTRVAEGARITFQPTDQDRLRQLQALIDRLELMRQQTGDRSGAIEQQIAGLVAERLAIIKAMIEAQKDAASARPAEAEQAGTEQGKAFSDSFNRELERSLQIPGFGGVDRLIPKLTPDKVFPVSQIVDSAFEDVEESADDTADVLDDTFKSLAHSIGFTLQASFSNAFMGVGLDFGDLIRRMAADFAASGLLKILASIGKGVGGPFGAFLGEIAGFAAGGRHPDTPFVAGERGPELILPDRSGTVIPNNELGGFGGDFNQTNNFALVIPPQLQAFIQNVSGQTARQAVSEAFAAQGGRI